LSALVCYIRDVAYVKDFQAGTDVVDVFQVRKDGHRLLKFAYFVA